MTLSLNLNWGAWWALVVFYTVVFWGLPMLGLAGAGRGYVKPRPYWTCVREVVSLFHISGALALILVYAFCIAAKVAI